MIQTHKKVGSIEIETYSDGKEINGLILAGKNKDIQQALKLIKEASYEIDDVGEPLLGNLGDIELEDEEW